MTERPVESTVDVVVVGMGVAGEAVAATLCLGRSRLTSTATDSFYPSLLAEV